MLALQAIPRASARLCLSVERFLREDLAVDPAGRIFLVGFSGGVDSTALLLIFHLLRSRLGCGLAAAHLDHGIRDESGEEMRHCMRLCRDLDIPFFTEKVSVPSAQMQGQGLEETARKLRYAFFDEVRRELPGAMLLLGHQLNDLAEDVLMRLIRGAGWPALGGMPGRDDERMLCRPLLLTPKKVLASFVESLGLSCTEDASNSDPVYFRNRVRHTILPLFLKENPSFLTGVADLWHMARLDEELFAGLLPPLPDETGLLSRDLLENAPRPLRLRLYKQMLEQQQSHPLAPNLLGLDDLWTGRKTGGVIQFPNGVSAQVKKNGVLFQKR